MTRPRILVYCMSSCCKHLSQSIAFSKLGHWFYILKRKPRTLPPLMIRGSCCARFRRSRGKPARPDHRWSPSSCGHRLLHSLRAVLHLLRVLRCMPWAQKTFPEDSGAPAASWWASAGYCGLSFIRVPYTPLGHAISVNYSHTLSTLR